jgi:hypothetical protein
MNYSTTVKGYFERVIAPSNTGVLYFKMEQLIEDCDTPFDALVKAQENVNFCFSDAKGNDRPVVTDFDIRESS